jgi:hypothetical protein
MPLEWGIPEVSGPCKRVLSAIKSYEQFYFLKFGLIFLCSLGIMRENGGGGEKER